MTLIVRPAMRSAAVAAWFAKRAWIQHVRTRHRAPQTNGVIERWFGSLKYEQLYRYDIDTSAELASHVEAFTNDYNQTRPHEAIDWQRPSTDTYKPQNHQADPPPKLSKNPDSGHEAVVFA